MSETRCTTCGQPMSAPAHHPDLIEIDAELDALAEEATR